MVTLSIHSSTIRWYQLAHFSPGRRSSKMFSGVSYLAATFISKCTAGPPEDFVTFCPIIANILLCYHHRRPRYLIPPEISLNWPSGGVLLFTAKIWDSLHVVYHNTFITIQALDTNLFEYSHIATHLYAITWVDTHPNVFCVLFSQFFN